MPETVKKRPARRVVKEASAVEAEPIHVSAPIAQIPDSADASDAEKIEAALMELIEY